MPINHAITANMHRPEAKAKEPSALVVGIEESIVQLRWRRDQLPADSEEAENLKAELLKLYDKLIDSRENR